MTAPLSLLALLQDAGQHRPQPPFIV